MSATEMPLHMQLGVPGHIKMPFGELVFAGEWKPNEWSQGYHYSSTRKSGYVCIVTTDDTPKWGKLLHLSLSVRNRMPVYDEIKTVRNALLPRDKDFAMIFPKEADFVNVHEYCLQIWEIPGGWGLR